jgi:membrane protein implicated in regulation of membrane protease activity
LVLILTGLAGLLFVVGVIALIASDPINWFGVGVAWFAGIYSLVLARFVGRRKLEARR